MWNWPARENPGWLMQAWLKGDQTVLEEAANTGFLTDPDLRAALLTNRNADWVRQLSPILEDDALPLVAVGAAHLVGTDGLPAMLEQLGYTTTRLN